MLTEVSASEEVDLRDVEISSEEEVVSMPSDIQPLLNERDPRGINECLKVTFEDVIAEPQSVRSGDRVWVWSHALFEVCRLWIYRIITALLAVPLSLTSGILFAVLSWLHIWLLTPCIQSLMLCVPWMEAIWSRMLEIFISPIFRSMGRCWEDISVHLSKEIVQGADGTITVKALKIKD